MRQVIGSAIYFTKKYYIDIKGETAYSDIVNKIPDERVREELLKAVISQRWYSLDSYQAICEITEQELGEDGLKECSQYVAEKQISGFYGWVMKIVSIKTIASQADKFWHRQFTDGTMECVHFEDNEILFRLSDYGTTEPHYKAVLAWLEKVIEISFGKQPQGEYKKINNNTTEFFLRF